MSATASNKKFKELHDFAKRQAEAEKIRRKYDDRIPIIVERAHKADIVDIDKKKYLVPGDLTVAQFTYVIRKRIKLSAEQALWVFVEHEENGKKTQILPPTSHTLNAVYEDYKDADCFLYLTYSGENVFGTA
jgi:GABA(A) receptor-associated protein